MPPLRRFPVIGCHVPSPASPKYVLFGLEAQYGHWSLRFHGRSRYGPTWLFSSVFIGKIGIKEYGTLPFMTDLRLIYNEIWIVRQSVLLFAFEIREERKTKCNRALG